MPEDKTSESSTLEVIPSKELKILYIWQAPSRPFRKRDKEFWTTVLSIVFLVGLILFFVKEWFLIAAIISLTFVYYVLSTVEPEEVENKITDRGIIYAGQTYPYENLGQFWFSEKDGQKLVNFDLRGGGLIGRISILVGKGDQVKIREILLKYLIEEEIQPNFLDNASKWLAEKVPLESDKKNTSPTPPSK